MSHIAAEAHAKAAGAKICIYCPQTDPARFRGVEHLLPQSFGTFAGETPTLDCVCDDCNAYFGRHLDQLLARDTYEGISRYTRGILSGESRPQRRLKLTFADAAEAGDFAGTRVAVDGTTGTLMPIAAQFHVENLRTGKTEVYFTKDIPGLCLPEEIYGKPGAAGAPGTWKCKLFAHSREEHDDMVHALHAAGINFIPGPPLRMPDVEEASSTGGSFLVAIEGEIDTLHKRALAEIFVNFIAYYLGRDEAMKARWDFLRSYVRTGEGKIKARLTDRPFWNGQETETLRFADDSINVRIENLDGNIVGSIQFYNQHTCQMILSEGDALSARDEIGHRYTRGEAPIPGEKRTI